MYNSAKTCAFARAESHSSLPWLPVKQRMVIVAPVVLQCGRWVFAGIRLLVVGGGRDEARREAEIVLDTNSPPQLA